MPQNRPKLVANYGAGRRGQIFGARRIPSVWPFFPAILLSRYLLLASIQRSRRPTTKTSVGAASEKRTSSFIAASKSNKNVHIYTRLSRTAWLERGGFHWGKPKVHYPLGRAGEINTRVLRCVCETILYTIRHDARRGERHYVIIFSCCARCTLQPADQYWRTPPGECIAHLQDSLFATASQR